MEIENDDSKIIKDGNEENIQNTMKKTSQTDDKIKSK